MEKRFENSLLDNIPHFATVSYAFCKRFPEELSTEIFEHILNKALNNRMVDPEMVFIDGTHIKASANKKKYQKKKVAETAKVYTDQLRQEVNAERAAFGKKPNDGCRIQNSLDCKDCPCKAMCRANEKGQKVFHILSIKRARTHAFA